MIYSWNYGAKISIDPERAYNEMASLKEITPESVLKLARNEDTELHDAFEWDDSIAAEKYRLDQARYLIRSIVVREDDAPKENAIRTFMLSSERKTYKPISYFMENKDEYAILLERAKNELYAFKRKYERLSELSDVFDCIDAL